MSVEVAITSGGADKVIKDLRKVEAQAEKLNAAVQGKSGGGGRGGMPGKGQKNNGYAMLALSQGVEDFSAAGMRGILNNIPQMLLFAGATPAMAAGISMVAVAATVAGPHIFTLAKAFDALEKAQKRAQDSIDRLARLNDAVGRWNHSYLAREVKKNKPLVEVSKGESFAYLHPDCSAETERQVLSQFNQ